MHLSLPLSLNKLAANYGDDPDEADWCRLLNKTDESDSDKSDSDKSSMSSGNKLVISM